MFFKLCTFAPRTSMLSIIVSLLYQILVYAISIAYFSAKGDSEPALANPCLELPPCVFSQFSPLSHSRLTENRFLMPSHKRLALFPASCFSQSAHLRPSKLTEMISATNPARVASIKNLQYKNEAISGPAVSITIIAI